jgi:hypothetical protein
MSKYRGVRYYQLTGWSGAKRRSQPPGGVSARVLKEFASDCWSQPKPVHGDQLAGAGGWYGAFYCCPGVYPRAG